MYPGDLNQSLFLFSGGKEGEWDKIAFLYTTIQKSRHKESKLPFHYLQPMVLEENPFNFGYV